jgi:hypothetical protein
LKALPVAHFFELDEVLTLELDQAPTHLAVLANPNIVSRRALAALIAGVQNPTRFDQQQLNFLLGKGLVLYAFRDDEHLARRDQDGAIAKVDPQHAVYDHEGLICVLVIMPYEIALQLYDLELIAL